MRLAQWLIMGGFLQRLGQPFFLGKVFHGLLVYMHGLHATIVYSNYWLAIIG